MAKEYALYDSNYFKFILICGQKYAVSWQMFHVPLKKAMYLVVIRRCLLSSSLSTVLFGSSVPLLIFLSIPIIYWEKCVEPVECNCGFVYLSL